MVVEFWKNGVDHLYKWNRKGILFIEYVYQIYGRFEPNGVLSQCGPNRIWKTVKSVQTGPFSPLGRAPNRPLVQMDWKVWTSTSQIWNRSWIVNLKHFFFLWRCDPTRVMASSFMRFLGHTQRRTTVGRTPLDEWLVRRRDLYMTAHNIHNRQTSMPPVGFEPTISAGKRLQTDALDRAGSKNYKWQIFSNSKS
jgi:hypothetical protein